MAIDVYKEWLGIPEEFRPPTHYQLLRVPDFEDDLQKIENFYKKLNAHIRNYATGDYSVESQELLNELAKAMLCLTDPERKRDYDESLGREFAEDDDPFGRVPIWKTLVRQKLITKDQAKEVNEFANRRGLSYRDAVVQMKLVDAEQATRALAAELGRPFVDLKEMVPDDSVLDQVPRSSVRRHSILPLFIDDDVVLVACNDEPDHELEDEIRLRFGMPMRAVLATPLMINQGIAQFYAPGMREEAVGGSAQPSRAQSSKKVPAKRASEMSLDELYQRRNIGILIITWSVIVSIMLDQFVLKPMIFPKWSFLLLLSLIVPPIAIYIAYTEYIKDYMKRTK